jgi:hypothetical protein
MRRILEVAATNVLGRTARNDTEDKQHRKVKLATDEEETSEGESPRAPPA